jgi:nitrogen PTS system EIIA component
MYLNIIQLAESLGVSEKVVEDWIRSEELPCIRDGARLSFDRAQVVSWAAGRGLAAKAGFLAAKAQPSGRETPLADFLRIGGIWRDVPATEALNVMERAVSRLSGANAEVVRMLAQRVHAPRAMNWAAVGDGLAMPHLRVPVALGRDAGVLAIIQLRDPAPLPQPPPDDTPVMHLLFFVAPTPRAHLEMVGQLSAHLMHGRLRALLAENAPDEALIAALSEPPPRPGQRSSAP